MSRLLLVLTLLCASLFAQSDGTLYVVTYIDVYPNFAADTANLLKQFVADSKKDAGFVRYEVMRDVSRPNHFATVEVWRNRAAYEAHLMAAHTKPFRDKLQPWLGSPYDERLYNLAQ